MRNPCDGRELTLHPFHKRHIPEPPAGEAWDAFKDSVQENGVLQPILITADGKIMDGGWRWRAAKEHQLAEIPCIVRPESDVATILAETLLHRKPMTKGAAFYLMIPFLPDFAEEAGKRRLANLARGQKSFKNPINLRSKLLASEENFLAISGRFGLSKETVRQAFKVRDLLHNENCKQLIAFYMGSFGKPERKIPPLEELRAYQKECRERLEAELYSGEKNLWNVISYIGGALPGTQEKRDDAAEQSTFDFYENLFTPVMEKNYHWNQLSAQRREQIVAHWTEQARQWKPELRKAVLQAIENV